LLGEQRGPSSGACERNGMKPYFCAEGVTIYHGDCREIIPSIEADLVVTDPPYGQTSLAWDRWDGWFLTLLRARSLWCFGSLRMFTLNWADFAQGGWKMSQDVIWEKHNGSNFHADRFRRVHEQIVHFYRGAWSGIFHQTPTTPDAIARVTRRSERPAHTGAIQSSTYTSYDGGPRLMRSVLKARSCHGTADHPTQKPTEVIGPLVEYASSSGQLVLDPFMGSGATLCAAKQLGRRAIGVEIVEKYCEVAAKRLTQNILFGASK
jgi:site-specific DNA-methyltransferase (adenine-specific)